MIIHLGRALPHGSSGLPGNAAISALSGPLNSVSLFGLAPRGVYLAATVTSRAGELLPHRFTHHPCGLVYSLLHLSSLRFHASPGRYPARCPLVFGLSSSAFKQKRSPDAFHYQGTAIITKFVEHSNILFQEISSLSRSHRRGPEMGPWLSRP